MPSASCDSTNSRSKSSTSVSRAPGFSVYRRSSTTRSRPPRAHERVDRVALALDRAEHALGLLDLEAVELGGDVLRGEEDARVLRPAGAVARCSREWWPTTSSVPPGATAAAARPMIGPRSSAGSWR